MKLSGKLLAILCTVLLLAGLVPFAAYADYVPAADTLSPEGDGEVYTAPVYNAGTGNVDLTGKTPLNMPELIASMLSKAGKGYSQANRYSVDYYDCSSLVQRCLKDLGITANVPLSTYYWDELLKNCSVGELLTFYGPNKYVQYRLTAKNITMEGNEQYFTKPGTIIVLIAPGHYSGHICMSLGAFDRQDGGLDPAVNGDQIIANTENYVAAQLQETYGVPASLFTNPGTVSGVRSIWLDESRLGPDLKSSSGPYNPIFRVEAFNSSKGVCVDNCTHGTNWTENVRYVLEPVDTNLSYTNTEPEILDIQTSEVTSDGYKVTVKFSAPAGVREVLLPTWTEKNGQDDLVWHVSSFENETTASLYIKSADHKNESGQYITHVYVTDVLGRTVIRGIDVNVPAAEGQEDLGAPEITYTEVTDISSDGYTVIAAFNAPNGVAEILMPTWTDANGQDDLIWYTVEPYDEHSVYFYVQTADHNKETGAYTTHIYVKDKKGNQTIAGVNVDVPAGQADEAVLDAVNLQVTDVTSDGYTVTVDCISSLGLAEAAVATWVDGDASEDVVWGSAAVNGNTVSCRILTAAHGNRSGKYITALYIYDRYGNCLIVPVEVVVTASGQVPWPDTLAITDLVVSDVTAGGYRVTVSFSAPSGVREVLMPTWTEANGQDDLVWHRAQIDSEHTASFYVRTADHKNESGLYITHCYVIDRNGQQVIAGTAAEVPAASSVPEPGNTHGTVPAGVYVYGGLDYAPVFDPAYYLNAYADLKQAFGTDNTLAFNHFLQNGISEGRQAINTFSVTAYRNRYEDLRSAFGNDLPAYVRHYLTNGIYENRIGY